MAEVTFGYVSCQSELSTKCLFNPTGHMSIMIVRFVSSVSSVGAPSLFPCLIEEGNVVDLACGRLQDPTHQVMVGLRRCWIEPIVSKVETVVAWRVIDD